MPASLGPLLHVSTVPAGDSVVVRLSGELDIASADELAAALADVEQVRPRRIVIDAAHLTFVDAAGLRPLVAAHRRLPRGALRLRNVRPSVLRVLRLLDLAGAFGLDA